jgi:microsomal dipeptidase-like Zn-dependent dipeptidase
VLKEKVIDFHCDLLLYLAKKGRTPFDEECRGSIPQMRLGGVCFQALPIFTETNSLSSYDGFRQAALFLELPQKYPEHYMFASNKKEIEEALKQNKIGICLAVENGSSLCSETDFLEEQLEKLNQLPKPLYISLTWNSENRFGGGALTTVGLKPDGKRLLEFMSEKGIAVDLSHASDALAEEILEEIDKKNYPLKVMASHSNFRSVCRVPRNLPDHLAKEIFRRGGVIGLNFVGRFVGKSFKNIFDHIEHGKKLGGEGHLCLGADFFFDEDLPVVREWSFFEELSNASCYPKVFKELSPFFENALKFLD